jgi:DNA-binding NtrC family response regulator
MPSDVANVSDDSVVPVACADLVGQSLDVVEQELIIQTLRCHRGNRTHAAHVLGISVRSLRNKIRSYRDVGRDVPDPVAPEAAGDDTPVHL